MTKIKLFIIISFIISAIGISSVIITMKIFSPKKIHYHAGFTVFEKNKKLDFSDSKYMYIKPCSADGSEDIDKENIQMEKAHLHDNVGDLVHVEENGAKWQDLFTNIRFPIENTRAIGYINNQKVPDFQKRSINPFDSLVVFIGENDPKFLKEGVTREYIETQSKKSIGCGD